MPTDDRAQQFVEDVVRILREARIDQGLSINRLAWMSRIKVTGSLYYFMRKISDEIALKFVPFVPGIFFHLFSLSAGLEAYVDNVKNPAVEGTKARLG